MKVLFVGHPGSGKTYAAHLLAERTGTKEIDIDSLLDNIVYFFFRGPYRRALSTLLEGRDAWIIDGYAGKRTPATLWNETDYIVYINLPKAELRRNVIQRYRFKRAHKQATHGQHLFVNVIKNLWQIYVLDHSLRTCIRRIQRSANANKLIEVHSRKELDTLALQLTKKGSVN